MRRFPCFLFEGVIVILDVEGILPVWHPEHDSSGELLGAFDFYQNAFRERCGIYFNDHGDICLDLSWNRRANGSCSGNDAHKVYAAKSGEPSKPIENE